MNHVEKFLRLIEIFFAENARFLKYYVRILALKIGDNHYDMGRSVNLSN